jgi:hypothetical protein
MCGRCPRREQSAHVLSLPLPAPFSLLLACAFGDAAVDEGGEGGCRSCQEGNRRQICPLAHPPPAHGHGEGYAVSYGACVSVVFDGSRRPPAIPAALARAFRSISSKRLAFPCTSEGYAHRRRWHIRGYTHTLSIAKAACLWMCPGCAPWARPAPCRCLPAMTAAAASSLVACCFKRCRPQWDAVWGGRGGGVGGGVCSREWLGAPLYALPQIFRPQKTVDSEFDRRAPSHQGSAWDRAPRLHTHRRFLQAHTHRRFLQAWMPYTALLWTNSPTVSCGSRRSVVLGQRNLRT